MLKLILSYKDVLKNIVSLSLIKFFDLLIPLIVFPFLIIQVGKDNYGIYAFSYALIFYFLNLSQYGFSLSAVKTISEIKNNKKELDKEFSSVLITKLALTFISFLVLIVLIAFIPQFRENAIVICFTGLIILGDALMPIWFFQGIEKMGYITIINLVSKSTFLLLIFMFINSEDDYIYIGLYQSIGFILAGLISLILAVKKYDINLQWVSFTEIKQQLVNGFSSFLIMVTPVLYSNSSIFLLGLFAPFKYVTYLEAGIKISGAFSSMNSILTTVFYPFINRTKSLKVKRTSNYVLMATGVILSLVMFVFGSLFAEIWIGENIDEVKLVIKILSLSPLMLAIISTYGVNGLLLGNKDKLFLRVTLAASFFGLVLGLIIIPKYDYLGAAITIIAARSIYAMFSYYFYRRSGLLRL